MTRMAGSAMSSLFGDMGSPDFSAIGAQALGNAARQNMSANAATARDLVAKSNAERMMEEAKLQAKSIDSAAAAQQQAQIGSMIGSTLSGIGGLF